MTVNRAALFIIATLVAPPAFAASPEQIAAEPNYDTVCADPEEPACIAARAALAAEVVEELEELDGWSDEEVYETAVAALDVDYPEVQEAGLRLLARGINRQEIGPVLLDLMLSPRPRLRQLAAKVMTRSTNQAWAKFGVDYGRDFGGSETSIHVEDAPVELGKYGFKAYPDAAAFPAGTKVEAHAAAIITADPAEKVLGFYRKPGGPAPLTTDALLGAAMPKAPKEQDTKALEAMAARVQKQMEEAQKKGDYAAISAAMAELMEAQTKVMDGVTTSMGIVGRLPSGVKELPATARWIVVDGTPADAQKALVVYRDPVFGKTIVRYFWM